MPTPSLRPLRVLAAALVGGALIVVVSALYLSAQLVAAVAGVTFCLCAYCCAK